MRSCILLLPSQQAQPQGLGGKLDARDEDDVGGEDGESGANDAEGCGSAHGLGRAIGIQPRPAPDQAHEQSKDGCLERCRNHVGEPQEDQGIAPEEQRRELARGDLAHERPEQGRCIDENRK